MNHIKKVFESSPHSESNLPDASGEFRDCFLELIDICDEKVIITGVVELYKNGSIYFKSNESIEIKKTLGPGYKKNLTKKKSYKLLFGRKIETFYADGVLAIKNIDDYQILINALCDSINKAKKLFNIEIVMKTNIEVDGIYISVIVY